jgi:hypothetical protein
VLTPEEIAELEAMLEPPGFELSDDPEEMAWQIITSAAHFAEHERPAQ